jgi:uncharacterized protein (TIRG00374 family)
MNNTQVPHHETSSLPASRWRKLTIWLLQGALAIALLVFLLRRLNIHHLVTLLDQLQWGWMAITFGLFVLTFVVMGLQFKVVMGTGISLPKLYSLAILRRFIGSMIPGSAEISFAFLAKTRYQIDIPNSVLGILLSRFWTSTTTLGWAILIMFALPTEAWYRWVVLILIVPPAASGGILVAASHIDWVQKLPAPAHLWLARLQRRLIEWLERYRDVQVSILRQRHTRWQIALLNLLAYNLALARQWATFQAMNVTIPFWYVAAIAMILSTTSLLPINFLGGLGTNSISLYVLLIAFNIIPEQEAIAISLVYQIIFYGLLFSNALIGWLIMITSPYSKENISRPVSVSE